MIVLRFLFANIPKNANCLLTICNTFFVRHYKLFHIGMCNFFRAHADVNGH